MSHKFAVWPIRGNGRYRVIVVNSGSAQAKINQFLVETGYDNVETSQDVIAFSLEAHENIGEIVSRLKQVYFQIEKNNPIN